VKTKIVKHKIRCDRPEDLLQTLPKALNGNIDDSGMLNISAPEWPDPKAVMLIKWFAEQGIHNRWANGYL
jgi:hypothetical protein